MISVAQFGAKKALFFKDNAFFARVYTEFSCQTERIGINFISALLKRGLFMSAQKLSILFLLMFFAVSASRAQSVDDSVIIEKNGSTSINLKFFMPLKPESWTVSLLSSGGITGGTRLLIALNSNGNVMCSAEEKTYQNRFAPTAEFQTISELITDEIPYLSFDSHLPPPKQIAYCSDCAFRTLKIDYRSKKSILSDYFEVGNFTRTQTQIKEIYEKLYSLDICN